MNVMTRGSSLSKFVWLKTLVVVSIAVAGTALMQARAQVSASTQSSASPVPLQPYTAPDQSASAGVPAGWKVTKGQYGVIQMSGPRGESISLGNGVFVMNGQFQAGRRSNGPISMTMPYQATLAQKYAMVWQQAAAEGGDPTERVSVTSATPIRPIEFRVAILLIADGHQRHLQAFLDERHDPGRPGRSGARHSGGSTRQLQAIRSFTEADSSASDAANAPAKRGRSCRQRRVERNVRGKNGGREQHVYG
jgi:hypothetical protein